MRTFFVACAIAALLPEVARAADNGFYLGGSIGKSTTDSQSDFFDEKDTGFKVIGGLRPLDWFGVEMNYVDLGQVRQTRNMPDFENFRFEQTGIDAFGVFFVDIVNFDLYAKAGVVQWDIDGSGETLFGPTDVSDDGTDFAWAVGGQARLGSFAVRLEYERFEIESLMLEKPEMLSLGFTWTFL
jgi:hypothetical protein